MHILDLPDDVFLDIFHFLEFEWFPDRVKNLKSLRLTCKRFVPLVEAQFFSRLQLKLENDIPALTILAKSISRHVRTLILDLFEVSKPEDWPDRLAHNDILLSALIIDLPNLQDITILTMCDTRIDLPLLTQAMGTLTAVQHLHVIEIDPNNSTSASAMVFPLADGIINAIINSSGSTLLSLVFDGHSNMSPITFEALRSKATRLQKLQLREFIGLQTRAALSESVPWACRETLKGLAFMDCRGAHSGAIAAGVANRLWCTNLQTLEVMKSGDHDDIVALPYPIDEAQIPTIERVHYEHAFRWELLLLAKIKAKEVTLTYLPRQIAVDVVSGGGFPGMEHLRVSKRRQEGADDSAITGACELRRVKLTMDAMGKVQCDCTYGADE